jgi:hypothetical protein
VGKVRKRKTCFFTLPFKNLFFFSLPVRLDEEMGLEAIWTRKDGRRRDKDTTSE